MNPVRHTVAAWASACLLIACGGGSNEASTPLAPNPVAASVTQVQIEGCVADPRDPTHATRVQAFGEDGRVIATAASNAQGVFVLKVPARQNVRIALDAAGHDALDLMTGSTNLSLGGCLREGTT
ncbi:MAG TPA: hypothetical protein VHQ87_19410 [Rhizobacter sp.]|nr:hypothetical protein [Rhizobacter sp.]